MSRFGLAATMTVLAALACGPFHAAAPAPTATPQAMLAATYTRMVAPANSALDAVVAALQAPAANMTTTRPAFEGYLAALTTFNAQLPKFQADVPASARPDVQQLRQGIATQLSDIQMVLGTTAQADWLTAVARWASDAKAFGSTAQLVRADLGLPPAS